MLTISGKPKRRFVVEFRTSVVSSLDSPQAMEELLQESRPNFHPFPHSNLAFKNLQTRETRDSICLLLCERNAKRRIDTFTVISSFMPRTVFYSVAKSMTSVLLDVKSGIHKSTFDLSQHHLTTTATASKISDPPI
uniref:Uncharacterized protein n=1 Tax=Timema cristinae TaxID=61476 RepID=A0A7R9CV61_TIMCR|nr:unnamed protein product [Timema cristinae]